MIIIDCIQRSPEWYQARLGKITASSAALVMYPARRKPYIYQLVAERLTGEQTPFPMTEYMQWGVDHEDEARQWYENKTGNKVEEVGFCVKNDLVGCSPDGLVGLNGLIEIKCPMSKTHVATLNGEIKAEYKQQMQFQMWVTGRDWCDFVSYDPRMPENARGTINRVFRDQSKIDKLIQATDEMAAVINKMVKKYESGPDEN